MKKYYFLFMVLVVLTSYLSAQNVSKSLTDSLLAYYPFDGNANDESGNGYHASVFGATLTTDRYGNPNSAYAFDGINQYMEIPGTENMNFETGGFSLVSWVKFTNPAQNKPFIAKHISGIQAGYFIGVRPAEKIQFYVTGEPGLSTTESYNDGNWHMVAGVYEGGIMYLYIDGILKANQLKYHSNFNSVTIKFGYLDNGGPSHFYEGSLDDIRIYNRSLSPNEIVQLTCDDCIITDIRAYLEGPFNGTGMNTDLFSAGYIPLNQPFTMAPWNYPGTESVAAVPSSAVDWVLVELRETAGDASTAYEENIVARQAGFINEDGRIVSVDGLTPMQFDINITLNLFAVIYHRNHLPVLSGNELNNAGGIFTYDFTTGSGQAYGGALAHKELIPGVWGMVSSDGDANGQVNNTDKNNVWRPQSGLSGYKEGDFSLDGQVNNSDKANYWAYNGGKSAQLPVSWSCGMYLTDIRDGQIYQSVQIGTQCWMAENLNIGLMVDDEGNQNNDGIIEKFCYDDNPANCAEYGGLYQYDEAVQYNPVAGVQGICPSGWHIPSDNDWIDLENFLGGNNVAGGKMKEAGNSHWVAPNSGATNSSGFTALPGGYCHSGGSTAMYTHCYIWSSDPWSPTQARRMGLFYFSAQSYRYFDLRELGFSVRCMKD